ncbi:unnamed protein product, partial [Hymenolepis diminuta]
IPITKGVAKWTQESNCVQHCCLYFAKKILRVVGPQMVRVTKILLCGSSGVGKTSLVYSLDALSKNLPDLHKYLPTYEDTYNFYISIDKNNQEKVRIYEIGGQNSSVGRHFVNSADAVILVYDLTDFESFATLQNLKADIDSMKDRREIPTVIIGNKSDQPRNNKFETFLPSVWSQREKSEDPDC